MLERQSIRAYLDDLASRTSTPGGGAAAAVTGAQAAALISMVCELTRDAPDAVAATGARARSSVATFLDLADRDVESFKAVMAAYKVPRAEREPVLQPALREAADVPLRMIREATELAPSIPVLVESGNPNLVTDVAIAALLLESSLYAARLNVLINLRSMSDKSYNAAAMERLDAAVRTSKQLREWHDGMADNLGG